MIKHLSSAWRPRYQFDVRYTRSLFVVCERIKPKCIAEANNLFNRENITP